MEWRYGIIPMAVFLTLFYLAIIFFLSPYITPAIVTLFIFSDPLTLGFVFTGVMILLEKDQNTLQALAVSPLERWQYLWSKAISLTLVAIPVTLGIAWFSLPHTPGALLPVIYAVAVTSLLFVFLGVIGVGRVRTFNEYIIVVPLWLLPLCLPLVGLLIEIDTAWLAWIPTQATLNLLQSYYVGLTPAELVYSYLYPVIGTAVAFSIAVREFAMDSKGG